MLILPPNIYDTAILAAIIAFLLGVAERGLAYLFRKRTKQRKENIQWYQELTNILKEMRITVRSRRGALEDWKSKSPKAEDNFDPKNLKALRKTLAQRGIDEPDQFITMYARELLNDNQKTVQNDLKNDMKFIETRLLNHIAKYPDEIDETILENTGELLQILHGMSVTGQITSDVEESIWETSDEIIKTSNSEIEDLQGWL